MPRLATAASARAVLALALLLIVPFALSACGGDGTASTSRGGETRAVADVDGTSVEVPVRPERVVALSEPTLDGVLALGVTPVATTAGRGQSGVPHYLSDLAGDVPVVGTVSALNYEAIAKTDPDLILVDGTSVNNDDVLKILRNIAPTFYAGYAGGDWREEFGRIADALGLADRATKVEADYDAQVARARERLAGYADDTFSIVRWQGGSASLILKELPAGVALSDLGLRRPAGQDRRGRGHSEPVSLENLGEIDADHLFFGTLGGSSQGNPEAGGSSDVAGARKALAEAEKVPGWDQLTAVRKKQVIPVDGSLWTSTGGPLLMSRLVDSVVKALA